jgi:hypothetical protein
MQTSHFNLDVCSANSTRRVGSRTFLCDCRLVDRKKNASSSIAVIPMIYCGVFRERIGYELGKLMSMVDRISGDRIEMLVQLQASSRNYIRHTQSMHLSRIHNSIWTRNVYELSKLSPQTFTMSCIRQLLMTINYCISPRL